MARFQRLAAAAGALTLASVFVAGPASADTPEVYVGSALGRALDINILGQQATFGVSTAKVTSQLTSVAEGSGQLLNLGSIQKAEVAGSGSIVKPEACAASLPVANVLNLGLACGSATATVTNNNPVASSEAHVVGLDISAQNALAPLSTVVAPANQAVQGVLSTISQTVPAIDPVTATLGDLVNSALTTKTLDATVGKSTSTVTTEAGKVTSVGTAEGATINVLPLQTIAGAPALGPLATITVTSAKATAVFDRATGKSAPSFDPALVTVRLLTQALGLQEIKVPVGQTIKILEGTPLETEITVANGSTVTNPDGSVGAIADGVKVHALKGLNNGILLNLAHAEAGVGGTLAVKAAPVSLGVELPRTGGTPWIPVAGVGVLGLAVLVRRVLVRA